MALVSFKISSKISTKNVSSWSYRWMMSAGIMTEKTYPYTAVQGNCQYNRTNIVGYVDGAFTYENINATYMQ